MGTVDIGVGASDPNAAMARFKMAWDTAAPVIAGDMASGRVKTRPVEIVNEVFGNAQFKDAGARFFEINEQAVDPQVQQLQQQLQQVTAELEKAKAGNETKLQVAQINAEAKLTESREDHDHEEKMAVVEHQMDMQELLVHGLQAAAGDARRGEMDQQRDERQIRGKQDLANAGHRAGMMKTALPMMMPKPDGAAPAAPGPLPDAGAPPQPAAAPPPQQGGMEQVLAMMATMLAQTQQGLKQNAQLLARMAESTENNNQALAAAMQDIARAMSAPKRLVRDENGRAIGVAAGGA